MLPCYASRSPANIQLGRGHHVALLRVDDLLELALENLLLKLEFRIKWEQVPLAFGMMPAETDY